MDTFKKFIGKGPNAQLVEEATSELLLTPDWEKNVAVCDAIKLRLDCAKEVLKALKKRMTHSNAKVQFLSLVLLESTIKNGGQVFFTELASYKELKDELIKIAKRTGSSDVMTARDQARKILKNIATFDVRRHKGFAQAFKRWNEEAMSKGISFEDVEAEDWSSLTSMGPSQVATDPRNYHQEARPQQQQQQNQHQHHHHHHHHNQQQYAYPAQVHQQRQQQQQAPMIVAGPNGQQLLVQPIAPGSSIPQGAVQATDAMQQHVATQMRSQGGAGQRPQQQQQQQQQQPQRIDPAEYQRQVEEAQVQSESRLREELESTQDQISLMNEMLQAAAAENRTEQDLAGDEILSQIAAQLRDTQGRAVNFISGNAGRLENIGEFFQYNDNLIQVLEKYSSMTGQVGVPDEPTGGFVPAEAQHQEHQYQDQQQQQQQQQQHPEQQSQFEAFARERAVMSQQQEQQQQQEQPSAPQAPQADVVTATTLDDLFAMPPAAVTPVTETITPPANNENAFSLNAEPGDVTSVAPEAEYVPVPQPESVFPTAPAVANVLAPVSVPVEAAPAPMPMMGTAPIASEPPMTSEVPVAPVVHADPAAAPQVCF